MFNDYNGASAPEELSNYVNGFSLLTNDQLSAFSNINELSFTTEQLIYIREYFKNVKKIFPTYNQLFFFNELNKIRIMQKKEYSIYSATAIDGAEPIMETSRDLLAKRNTINRTIFGAMPLSFASEVASEYLRHIGYAQEARLFTPAKGSLSSQYYIHTGDDIPLFSYSPSLPQAQSNLENAHNTLIIICPTEDMDYAQYCERIDIFTALDEISAIISSKTIIKAPYGIFDILMQETDGVWVNPANISEIEKNEFGAITDLRTMLTSCIGRYVFSTSSASIGILNKIAEQYALKVCIFAVRNQSHTLTLDSTKNPAFSFDFDFIQSIINFKEHREYIFSDESNCLIGAKKNVYITSMQGNNKQIFPADKILNFKKMITSATAREIDASPHKSGALTIIDAINALVSKGVAKDTIALSIHYSLLCGTDDSIELGKNLAAILGAYRSMIELCVSDSTPQISYNNKTRSMIALATAKTPQRQIKSSFTNGNTHVYFYELKFREDGLPDYNKYRSFLRCFYTMIERDDILSAFSINESLSTTIEAASVNASINPEQSFSISDHQSAHGMLFEVSAKINSESDRNKALFAHIADDIFYVGTTIEKY